MVIEEGEEFAQSGVIKAKELKIQVCDWGDGQRQIPQNSLISELINLKVAMEFMA